MNKWYVLIFIILLVVSLGFFGALYLQSTNIAIFNPKGIIALQQRNLIVFALLLSLIVVIPVIVLTFVFAWKFREGRQEEYEPNASHSKLLEISWWAIPAIIILILAVVTWQSTHRLDPHKPIAAAKEPITIQVVALQWKWLFIYPQQNIATVNFIEFPVNTPIKFELTADAPMNSFWIPQLGGQIYAMPGMKTHLNLMANESGEFSGSAAEISGEGFAGMKFVAKASSETDFDQWVQSVKGSPKYLSFDEYNKLSKPSEESPVAFYSSSAENLFDKTIMKFTDPSNGNMQMTEGTKY